MDQGFGIAGKWNLAVDATQDDFGAELFGFHDEHGGWSGMQAAGIIDKNDA